MRESKVTIKIPRPLYRRIQTVVEESGFDSPTDFIVYVLRDLMGESPGQDASTRGSTPEPASDGPGADFTQEELDHFQNAENFLWAVRSHLHLTASRAVEQLSFDLQVEVAQRMGLPMVADVARSNTSCKTRFIPSMPTLTLR